MRHFNINWYDKWDAGISLLGTKIKTTQIDSVFIKIVEHFENRRSAGTQDFVAWHDEILNSDLWIKENIFTLMSVKIRRTISNKYLYNTDSTIIIRNIYSNKIIINKKLYDIRITNSTRNTDFPIIQFNPWSFKTV